MSESLSIVVAIFMVFVSIASGGALFVSMKVSMSIAKFKDELIKELDNKYVRKDQHNQVESMRVELNNIRRTAEKERLDNVEIELHKYRDDLDITLKGILSAVKATHDDK